jgi:hypothetical protein
MLRMQASRPHIQRAAESEPGLAAQLGWHTTEEHGRVVVPPMVVPCCNVTFRGRIGAESVLGEASYIALRAAPSSEGAYVERVEVSAVHGMRPHYPPATSLFQMIEELNVKYKLNRNPLSISGWCFPIPARTRTQAHILTRTFTHAYTHTHIHRHTHTHTPYTRARTSTHTHTHTHIHTRARANTIIHTRTQRRTHTHTQTYIHTRAHIRTHSLT